MARSRTLARPRVSWFRVVLVAVLTALLATLAVGVAAGLIDLPGRTPDDSPVTDARITTPTPSETPARTTERIPRDRPPTVRPPMPVVAGTTLRPEVERRHQILPEQSAAELLAERAAAEAALDRPRPRRPRRCRTSP
jgi:hypothetical protein